MENTVSQFPMAHASQAQKKERKEGGRGTKKENYWGKPGSKLLRHSIQIKHEMSAVVDLLYFYPTLYILDRELLLNV